MKIDTTRRLRAGVFTMGLATLALSVTASAQTTSNSNSMGTTTAQSTRVVEREDDNTDWGWLGLLGLTGLAGLLKKPKQVVVDRASETTNRANTFSEKRA